MVIGCNISACRIISYCLKIGSACIKKYLLILTIVLTTTIIIFSNSSSIIIPDIRRGMDLTYLTD